MCIEGRGLMSFQRCPIAARVISITPIILKNADAESIRYKPNAMSASMPMNGCIDHRWKRIQKPSSIKLHDRGSHKNSMTTKTTEPTSKILQFRTSVALKHAVYLPPLFLRFHKSYRRVLREFKLIT